MFGSVVECVSGESTGISAVEPGQYYTRFVNWIRNDVIAHTMSSAALEEVSEE